MGYLFISYSHADAAFVARLAEQLRRDGVDVWSDRSLSLGDVFPERIAHEIANCAVFVPIMSPNSGGSTWVGHEADLAKKYQRVVMPIGLENVIFDRYSNILCEMTTSDGGVSERFRQSVHEACRPSVRFHQASVWSGHAHAVRSLAFMPDGGLLVSADEHAIRLWETRTGSGRVFVVGGLGPTWPVAVTVDGRIASAASRQPGVHLWSQTTGALSRTLGTHDRVRSMSFSPDGHWLATGGDDGSAWVWSAENGHPIKRLAAGPMQPAWPLSFSPDGAHLAVANHGSDSISVWHPDGWERTHRIARASRATALSWNPDSTMVVSGGEAGDVQINGISEHESDVLRTLEPHGGPVNVITVSPNGRVFASAGDDGTIKIIGLITGEVVQTLLGHDGPVYGAAFSPDGSFLISAGADKVIRAWRTRP